MYDGRSGSRNTTDRAKAGSCKRDPYCATLRKSVNSKEHGHHDGCKWATIAPYENLSTISQNSSVLEVQ